MKSVVFASGGLQAGWNAGASGSVTAGDPKPENWKTGPGKLEVSWSALVLGSWDEEVTRMKAIRAKRFFESLIPETL